MSWFYKIGGLAVSWLPLPALTLLCPPSLGSYSLILLLLSLSRRVAELLLPAGQFFSCCWPCKMDRDTTQKCADIQRNGNSEWLGNLSNGFELNTENSLQLSDSEALSSCNCAYHEIRTGSKFLKRKTQTHKEAQGQRDSLWDGTWEHTLKNK